MDIKNFGPETLKEMQERVEQATKQAATEIGRFGKRLAGQLAEAQGAIATLNASGGAGGLLERSQFVYAAGASPEGHNVDLSCLELQAYSSNYRVLLNENQRQAGPFLKAGKRYRVYVFIEPID